MKNHFPSNKHHKELLDQIKEVSASSPTQSKHDASYEGHSENSYALSATQLRKVAQTWAKQNKDISIEAFTNTLDSLYTQSESSTEKYVGGYLLEYLPKLRSQVDPKMLDRWLDNLSGWAQVDSLCQSKFSADDMLNNWDSWQETIKIFNNSDNISKRRASLVLLTRPVRDSENKVFADLALENIEKLKQEKDPLITKAISWLLREMIKLHKDTVQKYLKENEDSLPKIAVRETKKKLETGKK